MVLFRLRQIYLLCIKKSLSKYTIYRIQRDKYTVCIVFLQILHRLLKTMTRLKCNWDSLSSHKDRPSLQNFLDPRMNEMSRLLAFYLRSSLFT